MLTLIMVIWALIGIANAGNAWFIALILCVFLGKFGRLIVYFWATMCLITLGVYFVWILLFVVLAAADLYSENENNP